MGRIVDNPRVQSTRLWDIFCRVVDNYGDIGVCWRLAADLSSRAQRVRLWVDDPSALQWMAPGALEGNLPGIQVLPWEGASHRTNLAALPPADVWVEGFGCEIPVAYIAQRFRAGSPGAGHAAPAPVWLNLEYLSAESFVERSHALPSPLMHGPAAGHTRYFFYPGFTPRTGGLLREADLPTRQTVFDRQAWLAGQGVPSKGERLVSLFCYEPPALATLIALLRQGPQPTRLLVASGRAAAEVRRLHGNPATSGRDGDTNHLTVQFLPSLTQTDYDHLLWSCDLNFVRGEDSLVRAVWAGKPWVWQVYPQHDGAHHAKLEALLQQMAGPDSWKDFHRVWNAVGTGSLQEPDVPGWQPAAMRMRERLLRQEDLATRLIRFVASRADAKPQEGKKS